MSTGRPISEEDLHAYVDGALEDARRAEVEAYIGRHPDMAARVAGFARQRAALREAFAPIAEEPIPPGLDLARLIEARRRPSRIAPWRAAAAAIVVFALGGAGGWSMHGMSGGQPSGIAALVHEAADNYLVYGPDRMHPVEFRAANSGALVDWISERLQSPLTIPDLKASGYRFMGGRLVATDHGPAGLLMYDNDHGIRLVMLVRPMGIDKNRPKMSEYTDGPVAGFGWSDNGIGYSVVSAAAPEILHPLANEIRRQVNTSL